MRGGDLVDVSGILWVRRGGKGEREGKGEDWRVELG